MSLKIKFTPTTFILPPEGTHLARCYSVIDLGMQEGKAYANRYPAVYIAWELPQAQMTNGKPFIAGQTYRLLFRPRAKLLALLEGWRGKSFTPEELERHQHQAFDLKVLLGRPCYLTIHYTHDPQYPQPWAEITHATPLPTGLVCPPPVNSPVYYDRDEHTEAAYLAVPEAIRQKINLESITLPTSASSTVMDNPGASSVSLPEANDAIDAMVSTLF